MPEPAPQKHREEDADGNKPAGQASEGNDTHSPSEPRQRTAATERAAKEPRPTPKEEAASTTAKGKAPRKNASTPAAQPTNTGTPPTTAAAAKRQADGTEEREPEKPTE